MSWEKDLQEYADQTRMDAPTAVESQALVARARRRSSPSRRATTWALVAVAAAALVAVLWPPTPTSVEGPLVQIDAPSAVPPAAPSDAPRHLAPGRNELLVDVVEVLDGSRVAVLTEAAEKGPGAHTRLRLDEGRARFEVATRTEGASFNVEAGEYQVRVVGTAFEVIRAPFQVKVSSGVVEVLQAAQSWRVRAGERFADGRVHLPEEVQSAPPVPEIDALRTWVIGGQLLEAQAGLQARLDADHRDVEARTLGAQLATKLGQRDVAVGHWEKVIQYGSETQAQRARYEAAVLLASAPEKAEGHLRAFLKTRGPLTADARLRLAKALLAQGKAQAGKTELQRVIQDHPGATPARVARELLQAQ